MRSVTDEDLYAIAGHILLQPKIVQKNGVVVKFTIKLKKIQKVIEKLLFEKIILF
jgi:hypothetical protein